MKIPGFAEVDLVSHSGNSAIGEFVHTVDLTEMHSTWTESRAVLGRGEEAVQRAFDEIAGALPFPLRGVDSDNGSEFIHWHLKSWCEQRRTQLTRGRPYKKDESPRRPHIEQKNWTHVRKLLGWERYDSPAAVEASNDLYRNELRLWLNLFLPSVQLARKVRVGSKLRRVYDGARTPFERVRGCPQAEREKLAELEQRRKTLDPFELGEVIERKLDRIYKLANRRLSPKAVPEAAQPTERTRRGNGCGNAVPGSRDLDPPEADPHFHSRDDDESPVTRRRRGATTRASVTILNGLTRTKGPPAAPAPRSR